MYPLFPEKLADVISEKLRSEWAKQRIPNTRFYRMQYGPINISTAIRTAVLLEEDWYQESDLEGSDFHTENNQWLAAYWDAIKNNPQFTNIFSTRLRVNGVLFSPNEPRVFTLTNRENIQ